MLRSSSSGIQYSGGGIGLKSSGVLAQSAVPASVTGTLTETVLATIPIPAGTMGVNGVLRIWALWSAGANNANAKTVRATVGGAVFLEGSVAGGLTLDSVKSIRASSALNAQVKHQSSSIGTVSGVAVQTTAVDFSTAQTITLTATLGNTGDTITLQGYTVELLNP